MLPVYLPKILSSTIYTLGKYKLLDPVMFLKILLIDQSLKSKNAVKLQQTEDNNCKIIWDLNIKSTCFTSLKSKQSNVEKSTQGDSPLITLKFIFISLSILIKYIFTKKCIEQGISYCFMRIDYPTIFSLFFILQFCNLFCISF